MIQLPKRIAIGTSADQSLTGIDNQIAATLQTNSARQPSIPPAANATPTLPTRPNAGGGSRKRDLASSDLTNARV
jgi:hypothetical protein